MDKISLIYKVVSGQATDSEKAELDRWMAIDTSAREDVDDMKVALEGGNKNTDEQAERDTSFYDGLRKIESLIDDLKTRKKKIRSYKRAGLAVTLVVLSSTMLYIKYGPPHFKIQVTPAEHNALDNDRNDTPPASLRFDDVTLDEIINTLEKKYGATFEVSTKELLSCRFTGTFYRDISLHDIIRTLAHSIGFDYSILNHQTYELHGRGCKG